MDLDRKALLEAIKTVETALSTKDLLPLLKQIWFTGSVVRATDGTIGIEAPLQTEFSGGVPGAVLLGYVESLGRDTIKATSDEKSVTFSCEGTKIRLPLEPAANSVWPFAGGNAPPGETVELDEVWRQALAFAMLSVTNNTTQEERRGVTFDPTRSALDLYATDGPTVAWARMERKDWSLERVCVPGDFIKETLRLMQAGGRLLMRDNSAESENDNGVHVYSKVVEVADPTAYRSKLKSVLGDTEQVQIPDGLKAALERVELLKDSKNGVPAKFTFTDKDILVLEAKSTLGDLKEELYLEQAHPEAKPKHFKAPDLLRALDGRDYFAVNERCVMFSGPAHLTYLVAAYHAKDD